MRPAAAAAFAAALLVLTDGRRSRKGKQRHSYSAADCSGPWEAGPSELLAERCDFDTVDASELDPGDFGRRFSLRRPLLVRNSSANARARAFLGDRCDVLRRYGGAQVELGDPFSLAKQGRASQQMPLGKYMETEFSAERPLYFFDRDGSWTKAMGDFSDLLEHPPGISLSPPVGDDSQIIFAIGKTGSGIGFHQHS